jgi:hypothetical protein
MKEKLILKRASTPWAATHQLGDASLLAFTEKRLRGIIRLAQRQKWQFMNGSHNFDAMELYPRWRF